MNYDELKKKAMDGACDVCAECGKTREEGLHILYGPDEDNPRKHEFVSEAVIAREQLVYHRDQHFDEVLEMLNRVINHPDSYPMGDAYTVLGKAKEVDV